MTKSHGPTTILVIEDEAEIRRFISMVLEFEGYRVIQAINGEDGLRLVKNKHIALVLLDLQLPIINGWSILARLQSDPVVSTIPVVIITASDVVSQRDKALNMGAVDYLAKPMSAAILRNTVLRVLRYND
jgi:DNA-binding response OmpR family regulator